MKQIPGAYLAGTGYKKFKKNSLFSTLESDRIDKCIVRADMTVYAIT